METDPNVMKNNLSTLKKHYKEQTKKLKELELYKERQETIKLIRKLVDKLTLLQNEADEQPQQIEQSNNSSNNLILPTPTFTNNKPKTKKSKK